MAVFKDQFLLDIILDTNVALATATDLKIHYEKEDGTDGVWAGVLEGTTEIKYSFTSGDSDLAGFWKLQTEFTIGGRVGYGDIVTLRFTDRITAL